jgi:hypothetical protein
LRNISSVESRLPSFTNRKSIDGCSATNEAKRSAANRSASSKQGTTTMAPGIP